MPVILSVLSLALLAITPTDGTPDGVDRRFEQKLYPVTGETAAEIHRSLEANGPKSGGRTFYGLTEFSMGYRYTPVSVAPSGGQCRASDVEVRIGITVTLPQWEKPRAADPDLVRAWRSFFNALLNHEEGHVRLADEAAERLRLRLLAMRGPCDTLGDQAKALAERLSDLSAEQHISYDDRTEHGVKEGAVWTFTPDR